MASQPNAHAGILSHNAHTNGPSNPQDPLHLLPSASYGYAHLHKPQHNVTKVFLQPTTCTSKGHSATSLLTICTHGVSTFDPHNKVALKPQQDPHLFAHLPQTRCSTDAEHNTSPQFFHQIFIVFGLRTKKVHLHSTKVATPPTHAHKPSPNPLTLPTLNFKNMPTFPNPHTSNLSLQPQNSAITHLQPQS